MEDGLVKVALLFPKVLLMFVKILLLLPKVLLLFVKGLWVFRKVVLLFVKGLWVLGKVMLEFVKPATLYICSFSTCEKRFSLFLRPIVVEILFCFFLQKTKKIGTDSGVEI